MRFSSANRRGLMMFGLSSLALRKGGGRDRLESPVEKVREAP
jgi:hypothetical protein